MLDSTGFVCKKFLHFTSDLGMTLYWLKSSFSEQFNDPIASAICNVYLPSVLAASPDTEDRTRLPLVHAQSCSTFERWMKLALDGGAMNSPCNSRFRVHFQVGLDSPDITKTLKWLCAKDEKNLEQKIFEATQLMFLPIARSAFERHRVHLEIEKSRLIFTRRMDVGGLHFHLNQTDTPENGHPNDLNAQLKNSNGFIPQSAVSPEMAKANEQVTASAVPVQELDAVQNGKVHEKPDNTPKLDLDFDF